MTLRLDLSLDDAAAIIRDPCIYTKICDDHCSPNADGFELPEDWTAIVAYIDDIRVGCFVLHPTTSSTTREVHVQILPQYRASSLGISEALLAFAWHHTGASKFVACIPFDCENVKDFAEKMGFKIEGINEASIMKNGKLINQWYVGIKRWV